MLTAVEYIKYLFQSKKRHGVHSPFIYDFTDNCLQIRPSKDDILKIKKFQIRNSSNSNLIEITDHGVGSKRMDSTRRIKDIFKNSSSNGKYGELLYKISRHYSPNKVLELGTSLGFGTLQLSLGNNNAQITTVEGCPKTAAIAEENFKCLELDNIKLVNSTFEHYLSNLKDESFDIVFIDGHHDGKALLKYLKDITPFIHNDTLLILDDIRWSPSMREAWDKIISSEVFHVTIDLFRVGIISIRSQQSKEHFKIRM